MKSVENVWLKPAASRCSQSAVNQGKSEDSLHTHRGEIPSPQQHSADTSGDACYSSLQSEKIRAAKTFFIHPSTPSFVSFPAPYPLGCCQVSTLTAARRLPPAAGSSPGCHPGRDARQDAAFPDMAMHLTFLSLMSWVLSPTPSVILAGLSASCHLNRSGKVEGRGL